MLQKLLNNKSRIAIGLFLLFLLACIRAFENDLFYDPFLDYFKKEYHNLPLPITDSVSLFLGLLFRYSLNSVLSLGVIYLVFNDLEGVKFASFLYLFFFVLLISAFFLVLSLEDQASKMVLFYIRRFLIQPIFLLLFLPAFYFQKQNR